MEYHVTQTLLNLSSERGSDLKLIQQSIQASAVETIDTELKYSLQPGVPNTNMHTALESYIDGYHRSLFLRYGVHFVGTNVIQRSIQISQGFFFKNLFSSLTNTGLLI